MARTYSRLWTQPGNLSPAVKNLGSSTIAMREPACKVVVNYMYVLRVINELAMSLQVQHCDVIVLRRLQLYTVMHHIAL